LLIATDNDAGVVPRRARHLFSCASSAEVAVGRFIDG
jgi:hypothetical protein